MDKSFCWSLVLCLIVITGSQITTATEIFCYKCTYSKNGNFVNSQSCNDPFNATYYKNIVTSCTTNCYKSVLNTKNLEEKVDRGCFTPSDGQPTCTKGSFDDGTYSGSINCCTTDRCNGAELPSVSEAAFNCYQCGGSGCNDPFVASKATVASCTTSCYKATEKNGNVEVVQRGCYANGATCREEKVKKGSYSGSMKCCKGNLCNAAESTWNRSRTAAAALTGLIVAILVQ